MANNNVKCPLCGGFAHIEKPELQNALTNPRIRQQVSNYINFLLQNPLEELAGVGEVNPEVRDFQRDVHSWNPCLPMWRRSPKE
jgi:hypothetical protein